MSASRRVASVVGLGLLALGLLAGTAARAQERLIMGVYPGAGAGEAEASEILDRYLPLAEYLTAKTGTKVLISPVKIPGRAIKEMAEGRSIYKLFFGPPVFAAEAIHKAGYLPVVVEQERIQGVFVVKAETKVQNFRDFVETTRIAMPTQKLLLAVLANETLAQENVSLRQDARQYISALDAIILALDSGIADVAVLRDVVAQKLMKAKPARYRVVGKTVDAPGFALIADKSVPEKTRVKLRQAALALNRDGSPLAVEVGAGLKVSPFVAGKDNEFEALQRMMMRWAN